MSPVANNENSTMGQEAQAYTGAESLVKAEPAQDGPWFTIGHNGHHTSSASNQTTHSQRQAVPLAAEVITSVQKAESGMTPHKHTDYHEWMHCEYESQEKAHMEQLRQLEEDAWIAEQLSRTPSQHSKTDVASKPGDSGSSVVTDEWYPDTKHHELGKHYEGITGKQWDWRIPTETVMTKPVPSNKELVYAKVPPIAPDGGDEKMKTLENQLESITRTMEHLLALQTARQVVVAPVQHEELVTEDVVEQLSVMNNDKDDVQHGLITVPLSESTKPSKKDKKNGSKVKEARTSLMPASQLEPSSFLGQILSSGGGPLDDDSSDSSDSSGSDESQPPRAMRRNEDENSSSDYDQSSPTAKGKRPLLKPVNPEKYNGREDAEAFHKYVRQMTEYLGGYKVKKSMYASTASNFLTGKAYQFFIHKVSGNHPEKWRMRTFFTELFNYCFNQHYRKRMLERLKDLVQGSKVVQEYIHEFEEIAQQVGIISSKDRVYRLWHGFRLGIQGDLYSQKLDPFHSSWNEVVEGALLAEVIYMAHSSSFHPHRECKTELEGNNKTTEKHMLDKKVSEQR